MPDEPRACSGVASAFQLLKSPITLTASAFGAHTAKNTPVRPSGVVIGCAPNFWYTWACVPSLNRYRSKSVSGLATPGVAAGGAATLAVLVLVRVLGALGRGVLS